MKLADVRTLFAYNRWANRRLLDAVAQLSTEELDRDVRASFASMKGTLRHLLWGERAWLRFWRAGSFERDLSPSDLPDLPSIQAAWSRLEEEQGAFLRKLTEEKLAAPCPVDENSYVLAELIQHAVNHSTHHRGQVTLMLRQLGRTPPNTGFRQFLTVSRSASSGTV
ncbi:MAG TPA: DinB family protein [Thermoanaerobaculia bacterium]